MINTWRLLSEEEALQQLKTNFLTVSKETVFIDEACGRFLAAGIRHKVDQPPFSRATMDGYGYNKEKSDPDRPFILKEGAAAAGSAEAAGGFVKAQECLAVMTGAALPAGVTAVQRFEYCRKNEGPQGGEVIFTAPETSDNIIKQGASATRGGMLIAPCRLGPREIGSLAAAGYSRIEVCRKLKAGIISSGNELCPLGRSLAAGEVYEANSYLLRPLFEENGAEVKFFGTVRDDFDELHRRLRAASDECDIVVVSGGISQGVFDYTKPALEKLGVVELFHGVAVKPGKPFYAGKKERTAFFGLPGNTVSAFVCFELFIKPFLWRSLGVVLPECHEKLPLGADIERRDTERDEYWPARLEGFGNERSIVPLRYTGSSMVTVLADTRAFIRIERGVGQMKRGEQADVRFL
jgi:molybdopterin molybdotransferase